MSKSSRMAMRATSQLAPKITELAPGLTTTFVREALHRAIAGVGPLPPAADAAEAQLKEQKGHRGRAVHEVIENHVRLRRRPGVRHQPGRHRDPGRRRCRPTSPAWR